MSVTCEAPINIAVIKYWGKKDEEQNLPLNPYYLLQLLLSYSRSLSVTISMDFIKTRTTVSFSDSETQDRLFLNGKYFFFFFLINFFFQSNFLWILSTENTN